MTGNQMDLLEDDKLDASLLQLVGNVNARESWSNDDGIEIFTSLNATVCEYLNVWHCAMVYYDFSILTFNLWSRPQTVEAVSEPKKCQVHEARTIFDQDKN